MCDNHSSKWTKVNTITSNCKVLYVMIMFGQMLIVSSNSDETIRDYPSITMTGSLVKFYFCFEVIKIHDT